ncbi:fungal-specific transcription factor domain protein [Xylaria arbuscula]|nr:fungal-specific transcription factor domain protein [Xylaria arbuscula]
MSGAVYPSSGTGAPAPRLTTSPSTLSDRNRHSSPRRRDKPQLSCNTCRRRKVRCDRLNPCTNCSSRGLSSSCVYATSSTVQGTSPGQLHGTAANIQERIDQLENLVLSLMHQNVAPSSGCGDSSPPEMNSGRTIVAESSESVVSPTPSDHGSIRVQHTVVSYVNSSHWAAILDSITDLRNHLAQEEETHPRASDSLQPPASFPKPQLLYSCLMYENPAAIIKSLPPRPVVDRLVSRYFNVLDIAPGVVHNSQFLREYEEFWKLPHTAPIMWVGLLFNMMCLSSQLQQSFLSSTPASPATTDGQAVVDRYKEKAIQCLLLGHYTRGGPYVLETLILYFLVECFHVKDMEIGIWILVGNIVQIALHMGYHRDAKHFPNISPFAGEMRRRVWAMIMQLDSSISTQLGLPRLVKESQTNTAEPRNLYDSDFDENTAELPASRLETEVTPTLYVLAKIRLLSVGAQVADVATEPGLHSYAEILELDQQINEAQNSLPPSLKWDDLSSSLGIPSQVVIQRIWLEVIAQQLKIVLHRKLIEPARHRKQYSRSRSACFTSAIKILELQRIVDEETQIDGLLYQNRWRVSSAFTNDFLLATSILCICLKDHIDKQKGQIENLKDAVLDRLDLENIRQLLRTSQDIWSRQCEISREARKAVAAIRYVLGDSGIRLESHDTEDVLPAPFPTAAVSHFPGFSDFIPEYDFPSLESGQEDRGTTWPVFAVAPDHNTEQWIEVTTSQETDMIL